MNKSFEILKKAYKPYRYTIQGKVLILNTMTGDYVVKEKNTDKNIQELYAYLNSRSFNNFPNLVDNSRADVNVYEYIDGIMMPNPQKALDLIEVVSKLHNKTTFYKSITEDNFKTIYDNIKSNILYLENYYNELYEKIKQEVYMSPCSYSLIRNIYKLFSALDFVQKELDIWYEMVKKETKKRVCLIHNNLSLDHFIKKDEDYLLSWDNYRIDSPVIDLVNFYQKEYFNINFEVILTKYFEKVNLTEDEQKLFFILISLPKKIEFEEDIYQNCVNVTDLMNYLFITEELVRPYYTIKEKS